MTHIFMGMSATRKKKGCYIKVSEDELIQNDRINTTWLHRPVFSLINNTEPDFSAGITGQNSLVRCPVI